MLIWQLLCLCISAVSAAPTDPWQFPVDDGSAQLTVAADGVVFRANKAIGTVILSNQRVHYILQNSQDARKFDDWTEIDNSGELLLDNELTSRLTQYTIRNWATVTQDKAFARAAYARFLQADLRYIEIMAARYREYQTYLQQLREYVRGPDSQDMTKYPPVDHTGMYRDMAMPGESAAEPVIPVFDAGGGRFGDWAVDSRPEYKLGGELGELDTARLKLERLFRNQNPPDSDATGHDIDTPEAP